MTGDDLHNAYCAGREQGLAERRELDIEDQVLARLHDQALAALGMAKRFASVKGPNWTAMIEWSGASDE